MVQFFTLASSSSGNSYYFGDEDSSILIDCGISCKNITESLKSKQISPQNVNAIIITHEHNDHIKGLNVFLKKYNIPIFASENVINYIKRNTLVPENAILNIISDNESIISNMIVKPFDTSHDSVGSYGYSIKYKDNKISICTDTGIISDEILNTIDGSNLILIESNYERTILEAGPYPYSLKKRIESPYGHLSNEDCSKMLPSFVKSGTKFIVLAHLSPINNIPELASNIAISELSMHGLIQNKDYTLIVAPKSVPSESIFLSGEKNENN